jgi:hypothetical protein
MIKITFKINIIGVRLIILKFLYCIVMMWTPYIDHLDIKRIHLSGFLLYIVRSELNLVAHASRH